ncbi:MAG: hypothetical protein WCJ07_03665 [Verrucomicrobiota bacterium]
MTPPVPKKIATTARWLGAGLIALVLFLLPAAQAAQGSRWLLVFDTSSAMKKRLPATEVALKSFLASNGGGQIRAGDSVGVWTFDQQLHSGQFPLIHWSPANAGATASNLVAFIRQQRYTGNTSFATLQPLLGEIISHSERLTVVIFCNGLDDIKWTPYADGINQTFRQNQDERKNSRQPFALLLRTQQGKYIGCTVNFPPGGLTIPPFPPLPPPPAEVSSNLPPLPASPAPKPLPPVVPSLVIVGTNYGTNLADIPATNSNPPPTPDVSTNLVKAKNSPAPNPEPIKNSAAHAGAIAKPAPQAARTPPATNTEESKIAPPAKANATTNTTGTAANPDSNGPRERGRLPVIGALLIVALGLLVFLLVRSRRREHGSLITASMDKDRRPPDGN